MRGTAVFLMLLVLPVLGQDEARIRDLIRLLDDDAFEVREKAEKDLVLIGPPAVGLLKEAIAEADKQKEKAELKVRALSALRAIEFSAKAKQYYSEPKRITLHAKNSDLGRILADIEKQTGIKIDASAIDAQAKASLDAENAPLFKALDELCRSQEECSYEVREEGVRFQKARFVPCPSAYEGPFRIRITKLKQERSTDFKTSEGQVLLHLDADWQKYLKPNKKVDLEIRKATDDKGTALEIRKGEDADDGMGGMVVLNGNRMVVRRGGMVMIRGGGAGEEPTPQAYTLKGLAAGASRLSIQGTARFSFPLEKSDVVFDKGAASEPQAAGDLTVALKGQGAGRVWRIVFTHTPGKPAVVAEDIEARIDADSFTVVDDAGREHKGTLSETRGMEMQGILNGGEVPDGTPLANFQVVFPTMQTRTPKELRFKLVSQVFVKSVPFTLNDIALP